VKIGGKKVEAPKPLMFAIPRPGGEDIIFQCSAVLDYSEFEKRCPEPKPPTVKQPGKPDTVDRDNPKYLARLDEFGTKKMDWMVLQSLAGTPGLEWETVDLDNPDTWSGYKDELAESFTDMEIGMLVSKVMEANIPDEKRQKEALDRFVAMQAAGSPSTSQKDEPTSTTSGGPAND